MLNPLSGLNQQAQGSFLKQEKTRLQWELFSNRLVFCMVEIKGLYLEDRVDFHPSRYIYIYESA